MFLNVKLSGNCLGPVQKVSADVLLMPDKKIMYSLYQYALG